jgi:UDP-glucose 4-epimerase
MRVLITGGAGYICSHTCLELLTPGHAVVVLDSFSNSKPVLFDRTERICGSSPVFYREDACNSGKVVKTLLAHGIEALIHFAGLKAVGESVAQPLQYYTNNVTVSLALFSAKQKTGVRTLAFSSSATVYGNPHSVPIHEDFPLSATNPCGRSKLMVEEILRYLMLADDSWHIALLRYFNPVGTHESGLIGEDPAGIPHNLMPYISQVAVGRRTELQIFGGDYPTPDGTGVRDYIHAVDLARGLHCRAGLAAATQEYSYYQLRSGQGKSVLGVERASEVASGQHLPYRIVDRRPRDIAQFWADPGKAWRELGWKAEKGLMEVMADTWPSQSRDPNGYWAT